MSDTARGLRNFNPLNLRRTKPPTPWQGLAAEQPDPEFVSFQSLAFGIRAACRVLIGYQDRLGIRTVDGIIGRWAPREDNNDTDAYTDYVAERMGVSAHDELDLQDFATLRSLVLAMGRMECGQELSPAVVEEGLKLAGVVPGPGQVSTKARVETTVTAGAIIAGAAAAITQATDIAHQVQDAAKPLDKLWDGASVVVGFAAVLVVAAVIIWRRRLAQ